MLHDNDVQVLQTQKLSAEGRRGGYEGERGGHYPTPTPYLSVSTNMADPPGELAGGVKGWWADGGVGGGKARLVAPILRTS